MKVTVADLKDSGHYEASQAVKGMNALGYENNFSQNQADECRAVYLEYYKMLQTISHAIKMGVSEITLRTPLGPVVVPILEPQSALEIGQELQEMIGNKLGELEASILSYEEEAIQEEPDRLGDSDRAKRFAHCMPMRELTDSEFKAMPPEAQRAYNSYDDNVRVSDAQKAAKAA